jgi:hypothetical protein
MLLPTYESYCVTFERLEDCGSADQHRLWVYDLLIQGSISLDQAEQLHVPETQIVPLPNACGAAFSIVFPSRFAVASS